MLDCDRCMLILTDKQGAKPIPPSAQGAIASLKRSVDLLNSGQMPNVIELMSILGQVTDYVNVVFCVNHDQI